MSERLYGTKISTKLCVSVGPDGKILHHEIISPQERRVGKKALGTALSKFGSSAPEPLKQFTKSEGTKTVWLSADKSNVIAVTAGEG